MIQKPICGGDSVGIRRFERWQQGNRPPVESFVEEFLLGQDATFHMIRNSDCRTYTVLEHLVTEAAPSEWFDAEMKGDANRLFAPRGRSVSRQRHNGKLRLDLSDMLSELLALAGYPFIGRIDVRQSKSQGTIGPEDVSFLELNVAPTISNANDWFDGIETEFGDRTVFSRVRDLPIHPAVKSLAVMLQEFYAQSLSMQGNRPVREENLPN